MVVAPHLILLNAITLVCFGLCYASFGRRSERPERPVAGGFGPTAARPAA
jgi:hypothetical protein